MKAYFQCIECQQKSDLSQLKYRCECGGLINIERELDQPEKLRTLFDDRLESRQPMDQSGVWRFREVLAPTPADNVVCFPEGRTNLYQRPAINQYTTTEQLWIKHEGENPSGSFKDRGMTVAVSQAKRYGKTVLACASTGNTSASLAAYGATAGLKCLVFIPEGKISVSKLSQAIAYGAQCIQIRGDFDQAMQLVQQATAELGVYLVNSLNPFRIEGQKTIIFDILQGLQWQAPDWILVPGGNLGNTSAFGKALAEAHEYGWISKKPKLATIQASGANPFFQSFEGGLHQIEPLKAETIASAIRIGNPVNFPRARRAIQNTEGIVTQVTDEEILLAKSAIDRSGIGCEPASACSIAGLKKLRHEGVIEKNARVVCILTGHVLKDPDCNISAAQTYHGGHQDAETPLTTVIDGNIEELRKLVSA